MSYRGQPSLIGAICAAALICAIIMCICTGVPA